MNKLLSLILLLTGLLAFSSCDNDDDDPTPTTDYSAILDNTGENVILETYESLATHAAQLQIATQTLHNNPTQENLDAAKASWVATRSPWEQSEGFLFGPVDQEGIDPSLDSWPVNVTDLNNVLASANPLTVEFLAQQEGTLKGFHTIEFLLWGENGTKVAGDFTGREFEYLAAAAGALAADAQQLYDLWKPTGGNFIANILNAGNGSQVYISQKSALEEITNALIIIADEVGNGKINDPFVQQDLTFEESRFSANSKADFADNMRSVKNIYTGVFGIYGNGQSLSDIIREKNAALDTEVLSNIDAAINEIESIPGTFSDAVFNNPASVAAAQQAVRDL
ncbi:MAG TPA: imelysin family protein, partial [Saprospiraceae bacterium]